jgi:hypothetical protein
VLRHWRTIAALAWDGFNHLGRGAVFITVDGGAAEIAYQAGPPCDCHGHWIKAYHTTREVIVVVRRCDGEPIYRLSGWPWPPDAYGEMTAEQQGDVT